MSDQTRIPDPEGDAQLEELAEHLQGHPVGQQELIQRRLLGDERYEEIQRFNDELAETNLATSKVSLENEKAKFTIGIAALAATGGILDWIIRGGH